MKGVEHVHTDELIAEICSSMVVINCSNHNKPEIEFFLVNRAQYQRWKTNYLFNASQFG